MCELHNRKRMVPGWRDEGHGRVALAILAFWMWCGAQMVAGEVSMRLGPMVGHVGPETARIWIKATGAARSSVKIAMDPSLKGARTVSGPRLGAETDFAGVIELTGLKPGQEYFYAVVLDSERVMSPPFPSFKTVVKEGTPGHQRFAFVSCSGYSAVDPAAGWADLAIRTNVDLVLMLGDNHYANTSNLTRQRLAYLDQRRSPGFGWLTSRTPVYGIWDDHDYGPNDSDSTMPGREEAFRSFKEHWANPGWGEVGNPGVYFSFVRGDVEWFCLDGRYYRSPNRAKDGPDKTMLGRRQLEWLKAGLLKSKAVIKVLASGGEWQSYGTPDSWTSFARERDELLGWIEEKGIKGVVLVSGDRHFTAGYHVKGRWVEITSGPVGGNVAETKPSPEMFLYQGKGRFYCIMDLDTQVEPPSVGLEVYRVGMGLVERRMFSWDELHGRARIPTLSAGNGTAKPAGP